MSARKPRRCLVDIMFTPARSTASHALSIKLCGAAGECGGSGQCATERVMVKAETIERHGRRTIA